MLNENYIISLIEPCLNKNREISECEFSELFSDLTRSEQYDVIKIMMKHDIEYVDEKEEETLAINNTSVLKQKRSNVNYKNLLCLTNEQLCVMAQDGDNNALSALFEKNERFVLKVALKIYNQFSANSCTVDDLFQTGNLGMLEAVNHFDVNKDFKFLTYMVLS